MRKYRVVTKQNREYVVKTNLLPNEFTHAVMGRENPTMSIWDCVFDDTGQEVWGVVLISNEVSNIEILV